MMEGEKELCVAVLFFHSANFMAFLSEKRGSVFGRPPDSGRERRESRGKGG